MANRERLVRCQRCVGRMMGLVLSVLALGLLPAPRLAADAPTNFVFIIGDDISWNDYGCYDNPAARTPHIDELARAGMRFTQAYLTASSCSPSRCSIITGRYPHNNGKAAELHREIASNLWLFPTVLRQAGYYTALVGKDHMPQAPPRDASERRLPPFVKKDPGRGPGNRGGHATWVEFLQKRPREQPFFFWFASYDAHRGWDGDADWKSDLYGPRHDPSDVIVPPFLADTAATRADLASYYNEVTRLDYFVGQVVAELRQQQVLDNTLILVLADNGRPFPRAKTRLHDSGMKTALVAHWPQGIQQPGSECESLVSAIDIAPTILEIAGCPIPETVQGVSFAPLFSEPDQVTRALAFSEHNWHDYEAYGRSVRDGRMLFLVNRRPELPWQGPADSVRSPSHRDLQARRDAGELTAAQADVFLTPRPVEELYDVRRDPYQLHNLAGRSEYAADQQRLRAVMERWQELTGDTVPEQLSRDQFDRETGDRIHESREAIFGTTPGDETRAWLINAPGPR